MKTKIFTLFLALITSIGTAFAFNIYKVQIGELYYNLDSYDKWGEVTSPNYNSPYWSTDITTANIPATVQYKGITYHVKWIGHAAFRDCANLTSVTIPNSITYIDRYAFSGCTSLTSIEIPNRVTSIGNYAFSGCTSLTSIEIPNSVTKIELGAFYNCTGLTTVTIGNSVTNIGDDAFSGCDGITSVTINSDAIVSKTYSSESSIKNIFGSSIQQYVIGNGVTSIGKYAFSGCTGLTSIEIPNSVTSIGDNAFNGCTGLTSVTINSVAIVSKTYSSESSIKNIFGSYIQQYVIGNSVSRIGDYAFSGCNGLISIEMPNSVTSIGDYAFSGCTSLTSIEIPNSVTKIELGTFYDSGLTTVTIPNSITSIEQRAFYGCMNLTSVEIPSSVTEIEVGAFDYSGLVSVTINSDSIVAANYSTDLCLRDIFGNSVTSYIIGDSVKDIGYYAFYGCNALTSITIPNSVTTIGWGAFEGCTRLTKVNISDLSAWCNISFGNSNSNPLSQSKHLFLNDTEITHLDIPDSVTSIKVYAFYGGAGLTSVTIGNNVTDIGQCAFEQCTGLTSIEIPNSVTYLDRWTFAYCTSLTSVNIPNSIIEIGSCAFFGCRNLTSVELPDSVVAIYDCAFANCTRLRSVTFGSGIEFIETEAFYDCHNLTSVTCKAITPPALMYDVFGNVPCASIPLYVPKQSISAYKAAEQWKEFYPILPIGGGPIEYTITFVDWDGTELLTLTDVEEGTIPTYTGATPTRPDDEEYTYTFSGWTPAIVAATADATYTATYNVTPIGQGVENIQVMDDVTKKFIQEGQLFILRGEKTYTIQGQEVK